MNNKQLDICLVHRESFVVAKSNAGEEVENLIDAAREVLRKLSMFSLQIKFEMYQSARVTSSAQLAGGVASGPMAI